MTRPSEKHEDEAGAPAGRSRREEPSGRARKASTNRDADVRPVYAVVGTDRFLREQAVGELLRGVASEVDDLGPTRVDGSNAVAAEVLDEVRTPSLLGARRVVIVDEADTFISGSRAVLERYCNDPSPCGCLILVCNSMPRNTRLYKAVEACGSVIACEAPRGARLDAWLTDRAKSVYGKSLAPAAMARLREQVGVEPGLLDAELGKLSAYVGNRAQIGADDVEALTGCRREEKIFAVMDSLASGEVEQALLAWEQVLATDRSAPGRAVAGLAWSVRQLLEAARGRRNGESVFDLSRRLRMDPGLLTRRLERFSIEKLEALQADLLSADVAVKTGASRIESAIEKLIVKAGSSAGRVSARAAGGMG